MKAFVISNGQMVDRGFYTKYFKEHKPDYIICADGGANHLKKLGIRPNAIVGDLDSISTEELEYYQKLKVDIVKFPTKKNETDTQLAIQYATTFPINEIVLFGSWGDRIDHSLANIFLMEGLVKQNIMTSIVDEKNTVYLIYNHLNISAEIGHTVSLLPYSDTVEGISSKGLSYPLNNNNMIKSNPYGISNTVSEEKVEVTIQSGLLLVIFSKD